MAKATLDLHFGKFLYVLRKLYINILFTNALSQVPSYAKFLEEILSNKGKLEGHETVVLREVCSAMIQHKLPAKGHDSFSIPYLVGNMCINHAVYDLGSSVSLVPLSICE